MIDAQDAICEHDYQTNPVKIVDELGEVFVGGIDSINNVYIFERQSCGQVFEMPLSTNLIWLIACRNLADYRETPAPVNQLAEPAIAEETPAKFVAGQCYRNMDWATFERGDKVYKVTKRTAKYVYIATYSEQRGEWYEGGRYRIKENSSGEYVEYWDGERICAKFNGEQLTKPAIDRTQIEDSLTRAMKIALEHYKGFCHVGNLTEAENELKLYNICRKATRELWEE